MLWAIVGCLLCVTIAETAIIWSLVCQMDRLMRTINPAYKAESDDNGKQRKHFSMYQNKGDNN